MMVSSITLSLLVTVECRLKPFHTLLEIFCLILAAYLSTQALHFTIICRTNAPILQRRNCDLGSLLCSGYNSDLRASMVDLNICAWARECFNSSSANSLRDFWNAAVRRALRLLSSSFARSEILSNCLSASCWAFSARTMSLFLALAFSRFLLAAS